MSESGPATNGSGTIPTGAHEWVSFPDPVEDRTWLFDVTFLESNWTCIFGNGCQGVLTGPAPEMVEGCCSYGAHFTGEEDVARVKAVAATLTEEEWQFRREGKQHGISVKHKNGEVTTRIVHDSCIFLNRVGWPTGPGCALHQVAVKRGVPHLTLKPDVCWQLPLRRDDEVATDGHVTSVVSQWDRRNWGDGGFEFHWWCTESPEAFVGANPVYEELKDELVEMVGRKIYKRLAAYLQARKQPPPTNGTPMAVAVKVPHPAIRR